LAFQFKASIWFSKIVEGQRVMLSISPDGERAVVGIDDVQFADVAGTLRLLCGKRVRLRR
jgi:hypothetical protein